MSLTRCQLVNTVLLMYDILFDTHSMEPPWDHSMPSLHHANTSNADISPKKWWIATGAFKRVFNFIVSNRKYCSTLWELILPQN